MLNVHKGFQGAMPYTPKVLQQMVEIMPEGAIFNVSAIGITAGASAPEVLVEEVVTYLKTYGTAEVEDLTVIEEDVEFLLPKELITIDPASKSVAAPAR